MSGFFVPTSADMKKAYGKIEVDKVFTMAKCACVSCNSCTCACSCRKCDFPTDFWA